MLQPGLRQPDTSTVCSYQLIITGKLHPADEEVDKKFTTSLTVSVPIPSMIDWLIGAQSLKYLPVMPT